MKRILKTNSILQIFNNYLYDSLMPINLNYFYNFGSLLGILLIIQIISGVFLAMFYVPNIALAFDSIEYIMREVNYGWLIRYIHANGASFFFIFVYLHIARGLLYGSYIGKKKIGWFFGIILFFLMIATAFIGYSLVFGQMSLWGVTVITNLFSVIPIFGSSIVQFIWGGFSVGNATLNRFFSLHFLFPFIIAAFSMAHLIAIHDAGASNPLGVNSSVKLIPFHPYYTFKDLFGFLVFIFFFSIFVFYIPNYLGHSDNYIPANPLVTPSHIVPEWYFLPFYAILRSIPNKTIGVLAMVGAIFSLAVLPFLHLHIINSGKFRYFYKINIYLFFTSFILLLWIGQEIASQPFILIGQILTVFYFLFFYVLIPFISFLEFFLFNYRASFYSFLKCLN